MSIILTKNLQIARFNGMGVPVSLCTVCPSQVLSLSDSAFNVEFCTIAELIDIVGYSGTVVVNDNIRILQDLFYTQLTWTLCCPLGPPQTIPRTT